MKNYNFQALEGFETTDEDFQNTMGQMGIHIPNEALHTPELHIHAAKGVREQNYNHFINSTDIATGRRYTEEDARATAQANYDNAINRASAETGVDLRKEYKDLI